MSITLRMKLILHAALDHLRLTFKTKKRILVRVNTFKNLVCFSLILYRLFFFAIVLLFNFIRILRFQTTLLNSLRIFPLAPFNRPLAKIDMTHFSHLRNDAIKSHSSCIDSLIVLLYLPRCFNLVLLVSCLIGLKLKQIC